MSEGATPGTAELEEEPRLAEGPLTSSTEVVGHASTRDGLEREVREGREVVRTQTEVNVLANGRVKFSDGLTASEGAMKLMRMVADAASVKIEITDAEKENNTRYQVR